MIFHPTPLTGVVRIELREVADERGWFVRTFDREAFAAHGVATDFPQTNHSLCRRQGILRGLHYQRPPRAEAKLVRCVRGRVFDVAVDVRYGSPTFLQWYGVTLDADEPCCLYVGPGFAHGYLSLSDSAAVVYQASEVYAPQLEGVVRYDDPRVGIVWPLPPAEMSSKDAGAPPLDDQFTGIDLNPQG